MPLCVFATAGTTVLGGFDPLCAVHDVCREMEVWMHVDGSWGASVMLSERHRGLVDGIGEERWATARQLALRSRWLRLSSLAAQSMRILGTFCCF